MIDLLQKELNESWDRLMCIKNKIKSYFILRCLIILLEPCLHFKFRHVY